MGFDQKVVKDGNFEIPIWILFQILGKAEFLNPGGSVKDRVAVKIIEEVITLNLLLFLSYYEVKICNLLFSCLKVSLLIVDLYD